MGNKKKKKRKEGLFNYIMGGRIFTSDIFTKNAMLMGLIVLYSFLYVSNRYQHEQEIMKIYKLNKRKNEIRNNLLTIKSEFAQGLLWWLSGKESTCQCRRHRFDP